MSTDAEPSRGPLTETRVAGILAGVRDRIGARPDDAKLIKFTNNAVFQLAHDPIVVRIAGLAAVRSRVPKIVQVAEWLAEHDAAAVRHVDDPEQPLEVEGHLATVWHAVESVTAPASSDLGQILQIIHALPPPAVPLAAWQPLIPIPATVGRRCLR
jgi:hypothetical protein